MAFPTWSLKGYKYTILSNINHTSLRGKGLFLKSRLLHLEHTGMRIAHIQTLEIGNLYTTIVLYTDNASSYLCPQGLSSVSAISSQQRVQQFSWMLTCFNKAKRRCLKMGRGERERHHQSWLINGSVT